MMAWVMPKHVFQKLSRELKMFVNLYDCLKRRVAFGSNRFTKKKTNKQQNKKNKAAYKKANKVARLALKILNKPSHRRDTNDRKSPHTKAKQLTGWRIKNIAICQWRTYQLFDPRDTDKSRYHSVNKFVFIFKSLSELPVIGYPCYAQRTLGSSGKEFSRSKKVDFTERSTLFPVFLS